MREVRMTFGEHLEELRSRIIMALVWLALSVCVCLYFGKGLLKITVAPHDRAIQGVFAARNLTQLGKAMGDLQRLQDRSKEGGRWDLVFEGEIRRLRAERRGTRLQERLRELADQPDKLPQPLRPASAGEADELRRFLGEVGKAFSEVFSDQPDPTDLDWAVRFRRLAQRYEAAVVPLAPNLLQRLGGLGGDFDTPRQGLARFCEFLEERRRAIRESYAALDPDAFALAEQADAGPKRQALEELERAHQLVTRHVDELAFPKPMDLLLLGYLEGFMGYMLVAMVFGIFFALPLILYEMWKFVGAGLYEHEQRFVLLFLPFSLALFFGGGIFGFKLIIPFILSFLAGWGADFAQPSFSLEKYLGLFFTFTILLGLVFQTPLVMVLLNQLEIVSAKSYAARRKYMLFGTVVFATLVTPPDPLSWALISAPIMVLYELGIGVCRWREHVVRRGPAAASEPA